jgi:hypothetical protein
VTTMFITSDRCQSDRRRMKAYIASRIPEEGCRVVLADGPEGEVWVDLEPVRYGDGERDLHWETNCLEAVGLLDLYMHFRRQEMTWWEWGLEITRTVRQKANTGRPCTPACTPKDGVLVDDAVASQRKLITPKECQQDRFQNKISLRQVYGLFYDGEIDGFRVGRKVLLFDDSVEAYIGRNHNKSVSRDQEPKMAVQVDPITPKERPQRRQSSGFQFFHLPERR